MTAPPPRRPVCAPGRRRHPSADRFEKGEAAMWFSSALRRLTLTTKSSRRGRPPAVEELEPRLTPAGGGANGFRVSFMGPRGNPGFDAGSPGVAYNSRNNEYFVVWNGDDVTNNEQEIYGQRLDAATGALLGGKLRISDMGPDGTNQFVAFAP